MEALQSALAGEQAKRKSKKPEEKPTAQEDKKQGMSVEEMEAFMNGEGKLPSEENAPTAQFVWEADDEIPAQEISFTVNGEEMTDPAQIKDWVDSNIISTGSAESAMAEIEEE